MSELDDAMLQRMIHIVNDEHKPFSYFDFLDLMKPKTYRNKISLLKKEGIVESDVNSSIAFHTLKGYKFGKPGTLYPLVVSFPHTHPLYKTLQFLPFDKQSIHDIHLTFKVPDIYKAIASAVNLATKTKYPRIQTSEQIVIPSWRKYNTIVRIVISKTDTVSVTVGCSLEPIPLDIDGLIRFFALLARTEERLQLLLLQTLDGTAPLTVLDYKQWIITMWHFGRDGLTEYTGKQFSITTENAQHILTRLYSKEYGNGTGRRKNMRIRQETQEYPNATVFDAIEDKLEGLD